VTERLDWLRIVMDVRLQLGIVKKEKTSCFAEYRRPLLYVKSLLHPIFHLVLWPTVIRDGRSVRCECVHGARGVSACVWFQQTDHGE